MQVKEAAIRKNCINAHEGGKKRASGKLLKKNYGDWGHGTGDRNEEGAGAKTDS